MLQQRLREGKVYVPEQASRAIERFFRKGNLIALRELALRRTAERVDAQMRGYMAERGIRETWAAAERLLVCIGPSRTAVRLVRATRRMAARLHADWVALHVETPGDQRLSPADREEILRALELAEQLGGRAVTLSGQSVADEILAYARAHNVTRIVVGKPERAALARAARRDRCWTRWSGGAGRSRCSRSPARRTPSSRERRCHGRPPGGEYAAAAAVTLVPPPSASLLRAAATELATIDAAMLYLLAVVVVASRYRQGPAVARLAPQHRAVRLLLRAARTTRSRCATRATCSPSA